MLKRILIILVFIFLFLPSLNANVKWGIFYTGPSIGEIRSGIKKINDSQKLIPVGISYYNNKVYFMFIDNRIGATNYYVDAFSNKLSNQQIQKRIQQKINSNWVPFDLTYTQNQIVVLYLKSRVTFEKWKLVTSGRNFNAIQNKIKQNKGFFPIGFTFNNKNAVILLIQSRTAKVSQWLIKNVGSNNKQINPNVNKLLSQGYIPYGFEYRGDQVGICFLK